MLRDKGLIIVPIIIAGTGGQEGLGQVEGAGGSRENYEEADGV